MIAALVAAFAIAGAPSGTTFTCQPGPMLINGQPAASNVLGVTHFSAPPAIEVRPFACGALIYASASLRERIAIRRLNPGVDFAQLEGLGLLVDLHELEHAALHSVDECLVEATALAKLPQLLELLAPTERAAAMAAAVTADAAFRPYNRCS